MSRPINLLGKRFRVNFDDPQAFVGQGGMGSVYKGQDTQTSVPVAVKILKRDLVQNDPELVRRFRREGETLRQLNHPNIVKLLGTEERNGTNYLVMEFVSGGSLRDVLHEAPQLSVQRALYIALDLADALTRAHRLDVLHRDIKPGNVLLAHDGTPRLTDFGMARVSGEPQITQDGAIVGTLAYLAPEAFQGDAIDERTDIWAFGVLLWEMLAGERPFPQTKPASLIQAIVAENLPDLEQIRTDVPTALADLVYRMLEKNPQARIPSVRLIGAELETIIRGGSTTLQPVVSVSDSTGRFDLDTTRYPAASTDGFVAPNNLQHQPTPFVGREDEIDTIQRLITDDASLISLTGPGGMGKSRTSIAVAERQVSHFEDGVYFVSLDNATAESVATTIAETIDFEFAGGDPSTELIDHLSAKHMLLVLDNFETVMGAADFVSDLIANAPQLCVIVTSRERLRLRGEQVVDIDSMRLPPARETDLDALLGYPVVQLFIQSARRSLPGFDLTAEDAPYVGEIVRLVGGLPLGVELAAGWLEMLPLADIVTEIEKSLDFLETDLRDVPERHRSVRAVADYSWNLLTEDERDIFLKLTIFKSGFEREAAQEIAGASLRNLTTLVNKSLLVREPQGRYHLHKLLRQYGAERFAEHPARMDTHMAFADYYIRLATKLGKLLISSKEQAAFEALDQEINNIRYLWKMGAEYKKFDKIGTLIDVFYSYYLGRSLIRDGEHLFCSLADAMEAEGRTDAIYWHARLAQSDFAARLGDYDKATRYTDGAVAFFADIDGCHVEQAMALINRGHLAAIRGQYDASIDYLQRAVDIAPTDNMPLHVSARDSLAYAHFLKGDLLNARTIYDDLLCIVVDNDYAPSTIANIKNNLGETLQRLGDLMQARDLYSEALAIYDDMKRRRGQAMVLSNLAGIHFLQSEYDTARDLFQQAQNLYHEIGDRLGLAQTISNLGNVFMTVDDHQSAYENYQEALVIRREMDDPRGIADSLADIALCAMTSGAYDVAESNLSEALTIRRTIGDRVGEGIALAGRGITRLLSTEDNEINMDRLVDARRDFGAAQLIGEETGSAFVRAQAYNGLGEVAFIQGRYEEALRYFKLVIQENDAEESPLPMVLWALLGIAQVKVARGQELRALGLVTLILRYPRNFINIIEKRAQAMLAALTERVDPETVQEAETATKSMVLKEVVAELLAE